MNYSATTSLCALILSACYSLSAVAPVTQDMVQAFTKDKSSFRGFLGDVSHKSQAGVALSKLPGGKKALNKATNDGISPDHIAFIRPFFPGYYPDKQNPCAIKTKPECVARLKLALKNLETEESLAYINGHSAQFDGYQATDAGNDNKQALTTALHTGNIDALHAQLKIEPNATIQDLLAAAKQGEQPWLGTQEYFDLVARNFMVTFLYEIHIGNKNLN